jgi:hypothetical protein
MSGVDFSILLKAMIPECRIQLFSGQLFASDLLESAQQAGHNFEILGETGAPDDVPRFSVRPFCSSRIDRHVIYAAGDKIGRTGGYPGRAETPFDDFAATEAYMALPSLRAAFETPVTPSASAFHGKVR